jgi:hypothetical protein
MNDQRKNGTLERFAAFQLRVERMTAEAIPPHPNATIPVRAHWRALGGGRVHLAKDPALQVKVRSLVRQLMRRAAQ